MAFADAEGARIYYEQHGSGPAVMLIHGSGGHHMAWWRQVAYLARWFTVLTIDLRTRWVYTIVCYPAILLGLLLTPLTGEGWFMGLVGALVAGGRKVQTARCHQRIRRA